MIDINLLPTDLRRKRKGACAGLAINIPREILFGVGGGFLLLILGIHLILGLIWLGMMGHLTLARSQWRGLSPDQKVIEDINNASRQLNQKINETADRTTKKRVAWSEKLNSISDSLPQGVWLTKIVLEKGTLTIEGSVVSRDHDEMTRVGNFIGSLKKNDLFMKDFVSLELNAIESAKKYSRDVADFVVAAKLKADFSLEKKQSDENNPKTSS